MTSRKNKVIDEAKGPKVFLKRLLAEVDIPQGVNIYNPDNTSLLEAKKCKKEGDTIIARLDGVYFYKFTMKELLGFLSNRGYLKLKGNNSGKSFEPSRYLTININKILNRNISWLVKNSHGLIFQSQLSKAMHDKFIGNLDSQRCTIINNGIDLDEYSPCHREERWKEFFPNILVSASSYRPQKRLSSAIKLVNSLVNQFPRICLHVLGDLNRPVQEEIKGLDVSKCIFHGKISLDLLPSFYSACDLQLHLSLLDPCPNVVVEGLASGLPVVTPRESGAFELIDFNKDWSVEEGKEIDYYENHRPWSFSDIEIPPYKEKIISMVDNIVENKSLARNIAEKNLNIDDISSKYIYFINQVTESLDEETT
tara:strand:+ start:3873 stop:4973 length:1101 start_codon:yes stop_codon:yes gene_type:complete